MSEAHDGMKGKRSFRALSPVIHDFAYDVWPGVAWLLPALVLICTIASSGAGGLFLLFFGWIAVPIFALLGVMPRWIRRRKGLMHSDEAETWVLFLHWWAYVAIAVQGWADVSIQRNLLIGAAIIAVLMWAGLVTRAREAEASPPGRTGDTTAAWLALLVPPLAIVVIMVAGGMSASPA